MNVPTFSSVFSVWTFSPVWDLFVLVATVGYLGLVHRLKRSGQAWPKVRTVTWCVMAGLLIVTVNSSIEVYAHDLFWVHMIQHLLLIMVVPVLLVLAQPLRLLHSTRPSSDRDLSRRGWGGRLWRIVTAPALAVALYTAVVVLTHLTGFQEQALKHAGLHTLEMVAYLVVGYLFFLPLIGHDRAPWNLPYLLRFVVLAVSMGVDTMVGVVLMLTRTPLAPGFTLNHPQWGLGALADQSTAGAIMWFGGDGLMMILMVMTAIEWGGASHQNDGLGNWLEGIRRRELLGEDATGAALNSESGADGQDVDLDQQVLDAYNAQLAALHHHGPDGNGRPHS